MDLTALTKVIWVENDTLPPAYIFKEVCIIDCYVPLYYYEAALKQSLKRYTKVNSVYKKVSLFQGTSRFKSHKQKVQNYELKQT